MIQRRSLMMIVALALTVSRGVPALAAETEGKEFYFRADGGTTLKNRISKGYGNGGSLPATINTKNNTGVFDLGVGTYLPNNLRADLSYHQYSAATHRVTAPLMMKSYKISSHNAMLTGYYDFINRTLFAPYLLGGVGLGQSKSHPASTIAYSAPDVIASQTTIGNKTKNNFVYTLGAGTSYTITDRINLDLSYRYSDLGQIETDSTQQTPQGLTSSYSSDKGRIRTHAVLVGARYSF